jgi:hypothetical protein
MKLLCTTWLVLVILLSLAIPVLGQAGRTGRGGSSFTNSSYHSTPRATPTKSPVSRSAAAPRAPRSFSSLAGESSASASTSPRAIRQATTHFQANASRVTTNPGLQYARQQEVHAKTSGPLRLYKRDTETNRLNPAGEGHSLYLPNKGNPKANWKANSGAIRQELATGRPLLDSHTQPGGQLVGTRGFLNAERSLLKTRGYNYNSRTRTWTKAAH